MSRKILGKVVLLAVTMACVAQAGENRWTTSGPYGGPLTEFVFDPANPSVAYALGGQVLYKSTDAGVTWVELGFNGGGSPIRSIAIDPARGGRLYAASHGGLFRSDDSGATFQKLSVPGHPPELAFEPSPFHVSVSQSGMTIYVAMNQGPAFVSTDGGATFSARAPSNGASGIRIHPANESLFYGMGGTELLTSADAGTTWTSHPTPNLFSVVLALTTATTPTVWVAAQTGISYSTDNGSNWTQSLPLSFPWLSQDPNAPDILYAGSAHTAGPLFRYANGNWQQLSGGLPAGGGRIRQPSANANTLLASLGPGLHRSDDGGASWKRSDQGLGNWRVLALGTSQSRIFVGPTGKEFARADAAGAWQLGQLPTSIDFSASILAMAADPTNADLVLAGTDTGLYRSVDGGAQWTALGSGLAGSPNDVRIDALAFDPNNPDIVYAAHEDNVATKIARSIDRGSSFGIVSEDLPILKQVTSLVVHPHKPGHLLLAGSDFQQLSGLFRSTDGGAHWTQVIDGDGAWDMTVDATDANRVYASSGHGLKISDDGGATWAVSTSFDATALGFTFDVEADPKRSGTVYALAVRFGPPTTFYRLLRSVDAGRTWERIEAPAIPHWQPQKIAIAPSLPSVLYVSVVDRSVYEFEIAPDLRATIQGHSGQRTTNTASQFSVNVHNASPLAATDVALTITLPTSAQSISASVPNGQCSVQTNIVQCSIALVRNGQDVAADVNYTPTAAGPLDVSTEVRARERDPLVSNNTATATATAAAAGSGGGNSAGGGGGGGGGVVSMPLLLLLASLILKNRNAGRREG